ncbi:oligosaccharide flippase family protein [Halosquirtibacter xylanolyticus]|uniref:lipopolysaccharide biosynthesis protein n=1 Tax=Halosquirtibacter xylanolyticus TaxID=3374599 RepID=UPI0037495552|nr:oligosaccharide flippase family protein [Prolixibacteraceae bacterium]
MGILEKQTIKGSFWSFVGAFIAFLNVTILMPRLLSTEQVGLVNVLVAIATICAQFSSLGFDAVTTRMFPYFRSEKERHHGYPFLLLMVSIIGFLLWFSLMFAGGKALVIAQNADKSPMLIDHMGYIIPLVFFLLFFNALDVLYRLLYNAVIGTFMKEVVVRILNLLLLGVYFTGAIPFDTFLTAYVAILGVPLLALLYLLVTKEKISFRPNFHFITPRLRKEIGYVAFFGIVSGFSGIAIVNIDKYMVSSYLGLEQTGIYSIAFYFGTMVLLPARALKKIGASVISDAWRHDNIKLIEDTYKKSALYQLLMGAVLYGGIVINLDNIPNILTESYASGMIIIAIIGFSNVLEMVSGQGATLLATSPKYRTQALFQFLLMLLVVVSNMLLIPIWGTVGAAIATLLSSFTILLARGVYIYHRWHIHPFGIQITRLAIVSTVATILAYLLPENIGGFWFVDMVIRSLFFLVLMGLGNFKLLKEWVDNYFSKA